MKYVLDANAAIAALNDAGSVRARLATVPGSEVGIPMVAVAELLFGAHKSRRREENLARIAALKRSIAVLPLTDRVADLYGENRAALEARGIVKSDFDLIIACTALEQEQEIDEAIRQNEAAQAVAAFYADENFPLPLAEALTRGREVR